MSASPRTPVAVAFLAGILASSIAVARVPDVPYIDNETIGTFNLVHRAVSGPAEQFEDIHWAPDLLDNMASDDAMGPLRYVIAFTSYAIVQAAMRTPAYRQPYQQAMTSLIDKMLYKRAWHDWLERWGDNPLGPDNIMYTGHLLYMMTLHRQAFGDTAFEKTVRLSNPGGPEFETDIKKLAASIADQAANGLDAAGKHTLNVACEPGRIFVPCNAPHRLAQVSYDRIHGTDYAASNDAWVKWVRDLMLQTDNGVLYDLYYPFGAGEAVKGSKEPEVLKRVSGVYNGWSIWMLAALDPPWAAKLYTDYKTHFVVSGEDSPKSDGRTMVLDRTGATGLAGDALDIIATGFGMVAARQFADHALYEKLEATWTLNFGKPAWNAEGTEFRRVFPIIPTMFQNGFPLLAMTTTKQVNVATLAAQPWDATRFDEPFLVSVGHKGVFVNQAAYNKTEEKLVVTVNGGTAIKHATTLTIGNLDHGADYVVRRDGTVYTKFSWSGQRMVITTPPLNGTEVTYTIEPPVDEPEESGCTASPAPSGPAGGLLMVVLLVFLAVLRVRY